MKRQTTDTPGKRANSQTEGEAADLIIQPPPDQDVAFLAYIYWEVRGCPPDSPDEDWFRAEAELRNRLAAAATG